MRALMHTKRSTSIRVVATSAVVAVAAVLAGAAPERPVYEVLRVSEPPVIDGRLDEPAWRTAPLVGPFVRNADGAPSPLVTEAWMLYDDEFLYIAFRLEDENIWATMTQRDDHLWHEEVVEVFIQPDPAHPAYVELEVNPLGTMLDIFLLDRRKPLPYASWNSARLRWAVQVDGTVDGEPGDKGWTCEIALPHEDLPMAPHVPPRPGDRWRLNLYRVEKRPAPAALAWSPTRTNDFHLPDRFGEIVFSGREAR
jgi:hypothetical protein